ncbi:hypothetical protein LTR66_014327, partial [Elasticomyces elasticus]
MPKNPLRGFARRKSSGNVLDLQPEAPAPAQSSFRVLERPEKTSPFDGGSKLHQRVAGARPLSATLDSIRGRSAEGLGASTNRFVAEGTPAARVLKEARGSGGTTASESPGYYDTSSSSARFSSSSTLPSSLDADADPDQEDLFPRKGTGRYQSVATSSAIDDPPSNFTTKAGRALSFGLRNHKPSGSNPPRPPIPALPTQTPFEDGVVSHERAMTISSYASTAVPPKLEADPKLGASDFGSDFGNMFDGLGGRHEGSQDSVVKPLQSFGGPVRSVIDGSHTEETKADRTQGSEPNFLGKPAFASRPPVSPAPIRIDRARDAAGSPLSWNSHGSNDDLMAPSSRLDPPRLDDGLPVPQRSTAHSLESPSVPEPAQTRRPYQFMPDRFASSSSLHHSRLSTTSSSGLLSENNARGMDEIVDGHGDSEAAHIGRRARPGANQGRDGRVEVLREPGNPQLSESSSASSTSLTTPSSSSATSSLRQPVQAPIPDTARTSRSEDESESIASWQPESHNTTPRPGKLAPQHQEEESLFGDAGEGASSQVTRRRQQSVPGRLQAGATPKKMTKAQFEQAQRQREMARSSADAAESDASNESDEYEDEDDGDRQREIAKQRQKQEANLAVYRQQMRKVTGGNPSNLSSQQLRPGIERSALSAPAAGSGLHTGVRPGDPSAGTAAAFAVAGASQSDDENDDVPLGILAAHNFPSRSRPPGTPGASRPPSSVYAGSAAGGVVPGGAKGNLPVFARNLPADPYFGAGIVNQPTRETLSFNSGAQSVYGGAQGPMSPQSMHPGGLVGVIAGEERARAARRGSPNAQGGYGPLPMPNNMPVQPQMHRMSSMGNMTMPPSGPNMMPQMNIPGMPPMMPLHSDPTQQFMQMLQMQTAMMQQMMAMQSQSQMPLPTPMQHFGPHMPNPNNNFLAPPGTPRPQSMPLGFHPRPNDAGRAMTMGNPPVNWNTAQQHQQQQQQGLYAPA